MLNQHRLNVIVDLLHHIYRFIQRLSQYDSASEWLYIETMLRSRFTAVGLHLPLFSLGNEMLLTSKQRYKLRVDLEDFEGRKRYAEYQIFAIGSSAYNYTKILVGV